MKQKNPTIQTNDEIVNSLLSNTRKQYTEAAHAEIFNRLINTITEFNNKAERSEKIMFYLATAQVILAIAQIFLALK